MTILPSLDLHHSLLHRSIVLGADSIRQTWGENSAPAANDDGTGTALILSIARHISSLKLRFYHNVAIVLFSGEEQGLLGSQHFAAKLKEEKVDIKLALQTDMIGYRKPGEPLQMALPDLIGLTEARYLVGNISTLYAPELVVGTVRLLHLCTVRAG